MGLFSGHMVLLMFLYFIQGLPYGLQARFLPVYLRSRGASLTSLGLFKILLAPWFCKALWAPLVDKYGTKQKWLLGSICGLMVTCAMTSIILPDQLMLLCIAIFVLNVSSATQDIAVDGIAVTILTQEELGQGNTAQVVGYKIGAIFSGGILVWFMDILGWTGLFLVLTVLYIEALLLVYLSPSLRNLHLQKTVSQHTEICTSPVSTLDVHNESRVSDLGCTNVETYSTRHGLQTVPGRDISHQVSDQALRDQAKSCPDDSPESSEDDEACDDVSENNMEAQILRKVDGVETKKKFVSRLSSKEKIHCEQLGLVREIIDVPKTKWMMVYVLIYKLGEQGALGMLPLFLIDQRVSSVDVSFWTGVVGQATSIIGSCLGGLLLSHPTYRLPSHLLVYQLGLCQLLPLGIQLWVVMLWSGSFVSPVILYYAAIIAMNLLLILSGMVTTVTCTMMMECSKQAPEKIQATHYTTLATLEVFGKLTFMSVCGVFVDSLGYPLMYLSFVILSGLVLLWLQRPQVLPKEKRS